MNKQTREILLGLKNLTSNVELRTISGWVDELQHESLRFVSMEETINTLNQYNFYTACKLMVVCGFGDEII